MDPSSQPRMSLCQLSFLDTSLVEDVSLAVDVGAAGLSIAQAKLVAGQEPAQARTVRDAGLSVALAVPEVWTILPPVGGIAAGGPESPSERIAAIENALPLLALFDPDAIMLCTGPAGSRTEREARSIVVEAIRTLGEAAARAGTRISLEPMRESYRPIRTMICSLGETLDLIDEVGRDDISVTFDIWHLWDSVDVFDSLDAAFPFIDVVQVADYRDPTRGNLDRVLAGHGVADVGRFLAEFRSRGFAGFYDLEIFSDDGRFGADYADSLWKLPPQEFAEQQVQAVLNCWEVSE